MMRRLLWLVTALLLSACAANWTTLIPLQTVNQPGDAARGQIIFQQGLGDAPPCSSCHALTAGTFSLGPVMQGISERAGSRVEGMTGTEYLRQSIVEPEAFIVPGYRAIMFPAYSQHLDEQAIRDLIAYLETL